MKKLKLAILGYGNSGRAFGKMLTKKSSEIIKKYNTEVIVTAIATKTKGTLIDANGINLVKVEAELSEFGKFQSSAGNASSHDSASTSKLSTLSALDVAKTADYDVLIELTPLEIFSGQPAIDHIKSAFLRGKHVITANKGPIAWAFSELKEMAEQNNCSFFYETTVMDGTPVFNLADYTLNMCKITEVCGILNTTTNFILEELAKGIPYDAIMKEGMRRGFVEADPSLDIEGWDAAAKVTALMNVLMDANITPMDIDRKGIEDITAEHIKEAKKRGKIIKLLCGGKLENGQAKGYVRPEEVEPGSVFASITGTSSILSITTDLMGTISVIEHDPEIEQTAYGIFGDTLRVLEAIR